MPENPPTSPKKRSLMPSGELRRKLRGLGHHLEPVVQIGKEGATDAVRKQVQQALYDHELIKVRIGTECPQDRFAVADVLAGDPGVNVVQILGRVLLLYKRHPERPRYEGARAAARAAGGATPRPRPRAPRGNRRGKREKRPRR
jgi:RNA-binding protein